MRLTKSIRSKRVKRSLRSSRSTRSKSVKRLSRSRRSKLVKRSLRPSRSYRSKCVKRPSILYRLKGGKRCVNDCYVAKDKLGCYISKQVKNLSKNLDKKYSSLSVRFIEDYNNRDKGFYCNNKILYTQDLNSVLQEIFPNYMFINGFSSLINDVLKDPESEDCVLATEDNLISKLVDNYYSEITKSEFLKNLNKDC